METKQIGAIRIILLLFCPIVRGFLDIEELKNIKYGIDILNKPVLLSSQVCVLEKTCYLAVWWFEFPQYIFMLKYSTVQAALICFIITIYVKKRSMIIFLPQSLSVYLAV